jgi:hypothetical protein
VPVSSSPSRAIIASWPASAERQAARSTVRFLNIAHSQNGISGSTTTSVGLARI